MNSQQVNDDLSRSSSNYKLVADCGLYCGACGIYLATQENDSEKILQYALVLNQSYEETLCDGCGAKRKSLYCSKMCIFINCKRHKGVDFCNECEEFPCKALNEFKSKMPHRIEIIESQNRMKESGIENWLIEMQNYFSCPHCKTINSAYHLTCRKCGEMPSCKFVLLYKDLIEQYLSD
jgi:hypothetical protein